MNIKIKSLLFLFALFLVISKGFSQVGSPYSQFGFGDNENRGYEQSKAMGGIGIGLRSNKNLNILNPASYTAFDSLSIIYSIGLNSGFNKIESSLEDITRSDAGLSYFSLGFKGNKYWASSFGLRTATKVDYTFKYIENDDVIGETENYFHGTGGLNKVYWSNAFQITPDLSIGINTSYIFGSISKVTTVIFTDTIEYYNYDNTKVKRTQNIYDLSLNYGIQYRLKLNEDKNIVFGLVYENKMKMNSKRSVYGATTLNKSSLNESFYKDIYSDEISEVIVDTSNIKEDITLPQAFGFGFTFNNKDNFIIGADIYKQFWSAIDYDLYNASFNDLLSIRGGLEYTPDANNVNYYYKRVQYRFGGHYTQSRLEVKNTRIDDYGISFGVGLPLRNTKTSFNVSCEFGQRGTLEQNLLRETYGIISLNLSLSDIWFVKRKFK